MDIKKIKEEQEQNIINSIMEYVKVFGEDCELHRHGGVFDDRLTRTDLRILMNTDKKICEIQKDNKDNIKLKKINLCGAHILVNVK